MPCSRSARSPSVSRARLTYSKPHWVLVRSTASIWSSNSDLASYSSRPIRVLLPSSTEPAVVRRRRSARMSEVSLALAVLHGRLGDPVVGPGSTPFGQPGDGHLGDDVGHGGGGGFHGAGAGHVADGPVPDHSFEGLLTRTELDVGPDGKEHPVTGEDLPAV